MLAALLLLAGSCMGEPEPASQVRLIPPEDSEFAERETPEVEGECQTSVECEISCQHSCALPAVGPVTCPSEPEPTPERVTDALCGCLGTVCAWYLPQ